MWLLSPLRNLLCPLTDYICYHSHHCYYHMMMMTTMIIIIISLQYIMYYITYVLQFKLHTVCIKHLDYYICNY